jgi:hypothetical protein
MDTNTIREAVLRRPFQPFTLRMNNGREFHIPHPEFVAVSRRTVVVVDAATEAAIMLEPVLIASLKPEPEKTPPPSPTTP